MFQSVAMTNSQLPTIIRLSQTIRKTMQKSYFSVMVVLYMFKISLFPENSAIENGTACAMPLIVVQYFLLSSSICLSISGIGVAKC